MRWQLFVVIPFVAPLSACAQQPADPSAVSANLIPNGSFEASGQGSLETWQLPNPSLASLSAEAAPGGGNWSLRLAADAAPSSGQARFAVPGLKDGDAVRLSVFVRAPGAQGGGRAAIEVQARDGHLRRSEFASSADPDWTRVSVTETLSLQPGDTVWVVLSSPPTQLAARAGLFDLVSFERTGP